MVDDLPPDPIHATILQTSRLFLRNLSFACTEAELLDLFQAYGEVVQVSIYSSKFVCLISKMSGMECFGMTKLYRDIRLACEVVDPQGNR